MPAFCIRASLVLSLAALNAVSSAEAAEIYKCTDVNGVVVFSESSCGREAKKLDLRGQVTSGSMAGVPVKVPEVGAHPSRGLPTGSVDGKEAGADGVFDSAGGKDWAAFKCSTAKGMVFYRFAHCPKTIEVTRQRAEGEVQTVILDSWPVEERGTNVPTACQAIHGRSAAKRWGHEYDDGSVASDPRSAAGRDLCAKPTR